MAGLREFRAGEIWFYYNEDATKSNEKRKELGAVTSRPVLIIQDAFYPEWCESITVLPMTSSDRRSGIRVDSTVFSDGSVVEGGTILPYLFYTVKTKFLFPVAVEGKATKPKLLTVAPEIFAEIKAAVAYHLGFSSEVPEYVKQWKHLDDFGRNVVMKDIQLVTSIWGYSKAQTVPLVQEKDSVDQIENHIVAVCTSGDILKKYSEDSTKAIEDFSIDQLVSLRKKMNPGSTANVLFRKYDRDNEDLINFLGDITKGNEAHQSRVYPGSKFLTEVPFSQAPSYMTPEERLEVSVMSGRDIMENTGITSLSSSYRLLRRLKETHEEDMKQYAEESTEESTEAVPQFNDARRVPVRARLRKNAKRKKRLFEFSKEIQLSFVSKNDAELMAEYPEFSISDICFIRSKVVAMYPNEAVDGTVLKSLQDKTNAELEKVDAQPRYEMWETLSPHELNEVASASKRNLAALAKKYGMQRPKFTNLKDQCICAVRKGGNHQTPIDMEHKDDICKKVIQTNDLQEIDSAELLVFCRMSPQDIMEIYSSVIHSASTPGKDEIAILKRRVRSIITKKS